jgi:hypothetical protein
MDVEPMDVSDSVPVTGDVNVITSWARRHPAANDAYLRSAFQRVLDESKMVPPEERLIMYDACDEAEVKAPLGAHFRRRLDARRNTKPKKSDDQTRVCTPFNENGFHFGKIKNDRERLVKLDLSGSGRYDILTNKFPLFPKHMLLVANKLVPQQMTGTHLNAIAELLQATTGFCAYFNSWCASASVNHFHCHLIDEFPPVTTFPLVSGPTVAGVRCLQPEGFPGFCYVFPMAASSLVEMCLNEMQKDNQPHNLLFTPRLIYVFPKPHARPARSFELYPETVGGPELIGSFTVYQQDNYDSLSVESVNALCRMNTSPLPSRLLRVGASFDDAAISTAAPNITTLRRPVIPMGGSATQQVLPGGIPMERGRSSDSLPRFPSIGTRLHEETWPQDRPIARALQNNIGLI